MITSCGFDDSSYKLSSAKLSQDDDPPGTPSQVPAEVCDTMTSLADWLRSDDAEHLSKARQQYL